MTRINGQIICGIRGGANYEQAIKPSFSSGLCPNGMAPCSNSTSIQNTFCYPEQELSTLCPITMLEIVDQETGDQAMSDELVSVIDYDVNDPQ